MAVVGSGRLPGGGPSATPRRMRRNDESIPHLRSAREVGGYKVEAGDGVIGEVIDFLVDGRTWGIREIVIECGHWYAGKKVVVPTERVSRIDYNQSTVFLDSTKRAMMDASESRPGIEHDDALQPEARNHDATIENRINIVESTMLILFSIVASWFRAFGCKTRHARCLTAILRRPSSRASSSPGKRSIDRSRFERPVLWVRRLSCRHTNGRTQSRFRESPMSCHRPENR